jgi:hypothetical protein
MPCPPRFNGALSARPQKISLEEKRASGVRGLLIYCADYRCSHSIAISADRWPHAGRTAPAFLGMTRC